MRDANGNLATLAYDGFDRQTRWTFPSTTSVGQVNAADYEAYGYDAAGNRTSLRKRDGVTLTYQYDNLNRVIVKTVPASASGAAGYSVYTGYDVRGLPLYARFGSASGAGITNAYDGYGRLTSSTTTMDGTSRTLNAQYDAGGSRTVLSGDAGYYAAFTNDAAGRMTAIQGNLSIGYDGLGRRTSVSFGPDGTTSSASYGYDPVGRLQNLGRDLAGTGGDETKGLSYNPASQVTGETGNNVAYAFPDAFAVTRSYAVNGLKQYTSAGPASFAYDANGNLRADGASNYVYDAENRLVQATGAKSATGAVRPTW